MGQNQVVVGIDNEKILQSLIQEGKIYLNNFLVNLYSRWSLKTTICFLKLLLAEFGKNYSYFTNECTLESDFYKVLESIIIDFQIDGDVLLELQDDFFTIHIKQVLGDDLSEQKNQFLSVLKFTLSEMKNKVPKVLKVKVPQRDDIPKDFKEIIMYYHKESMHTETESSRVIKQRDWHSQPNSCKRFSGSRFIQLPTEFQEQNTVKYVDLFKLKDSKKITKETISELCYYGCSISAFKYNYFKRVNASSGGLQPIEVYIICDQIENSPKLYHYVAKNHGLEIRADFDSDLWNQLKEMISTDFFLIGISSISWREVWKYGERGFRYSQLDVGHLITSLILSMKLQGWYFYVLDIIADNLLQEILCIEELTKEIEVGELLILCTTKKLDDLKVNIKQDFINNLVDKIHGRSIRLSKEIHEWEIIPAIINATTNLKHQDERIFNKISEYKRDTKIDTLSSSIIRSRRSGLEFLEKDISSETFFEIIKQVILCFNPELFSNHSQDIIFGVHVLRVNDLPSGYYFLFRDLESKDLSLKLTNDGLSIPKELKDYFFIYQEEEMKKIAKRASEDSCGQNIVYQSSFTISMFSKIQLDNQYKKVHWECGMIGQLLYNEAELHNLRGTALGCFVDDVCRKSFKLEDSPYYPFLNFTIGIPNPDYNIASKFEYGHENNDFIEEIKENLIRKEKKK